MNHDNLNPLAGKKILLCVTGSVAAYKSCDVIRTLRKDGATVQVAMTSAAEKFIGVATLAALTGNDVITTMFPKSPKAGLEHIELSMTMDALVVLPATANILGKAANGVADDLVSSLLAVCEQPTLFAPAMNYKMWENPATMQAVATLRQRGKLVLDPESGYLASLHEGAGRLPKLTVIMNAIRELFEVPLPLKGKRVLVMAGPTREPIDPVRYISNRSSGKMGFALAESARDMGADVYLVTGPVGLPDPAEMTLQKVKTVSEMLQAVQQELANNEYDFIFMAAAPADYTVTEPSTQKIKRQSSNLQLTLSAAPDILKTMRPKANATVIAFALETENGESEAQRKMTDKGADFIVLNYANKPGEGFDSSTNQVTVFTKNGDKFHISKDRKDRVGKKIIEIVLSNRP
ncbi:MAG: bifunctional phosphopantothenoylcysteine decarboxylase/phosphopantothenate--cysteine ligase CoaBC [Candidatus Marinimicrobia bacterium]|nr:bifunctional phosphopantothenoylcysteine decarboxylase/phosphopantothenate--cysteine ligase CoaBC [Candidatus Neomarinimicrobiota bacterium]